MENINSQNYPARIDSFEAAERGFRFSGITTFSTYNLRCFERLKPNYFDSV